MILHKFWWKNCEKQASIKQIIEKLKMGGLLAESNGEIWYKLLNKKISVH